MRNDDENNPPPPPTSTPEPGTFNLLLLVATSAAITRWLRVPRASQKQSTLASGENKIMPNAIVRDPEVMHGTPVFRGTRVPVQTLFEYLEGGDTLEDFLQGFPTVSRALAIQALEEAKGLLLARV